MRRWLLYHIPKTGGTSISQHLGAELGTGYQSVTIEERPGSMTPGEVNASPPERLAVIRVFHGHGVGRFILDRLPRGPISELVVLREPAARIISHYNFKVARQALGRNQSISFERFLLQTPPDFTLRFLCTRLGYPVDARALDRVIHALSGMYVLTTTEVDAAVKALSRAFGIPDIAPRRNVSGVDFPIQLEANPELVERLRQLNPLDTILFETAREMGPTSITRLNKIPREEI